MIFQDKEGKFLKSDELDDLMPWEIEEREVHLYDQYWDVY